MAEDKHVLFGALGESPQVITETLDQILELPGVYLELQFGIAGLETKSEKHESS